MHSDVYMSDFLIYDLHFRVAQQCQRRIMLTGTPLQNDLGELQNLLQFILPDVFDKDEVDRSSHLQVCLRLSAYTS